MLSAIRGAIMAIINTAISVVTLPLRVLKRLVGGASGTAHKRRRGPRPRRVA